MRIRTFCKLIEVESLKRHTLNDSVVVIDGQNFFYNLYLQSGLQYIFGCESDKYAKYIRNYLGMFHKANVKCYFIFKGGHEDLEKRLSTVKTNHYHGKDFVIGKTNDKIVLPVFMKDVYKQILDEMGFNYTICEYECTKECTAFAQKHQCPLISFSVEYCFSGVPYIPYTSLEFDERTNKLTCGLFSLDNFLQQYHLTEEKLALFATLTDEKLFPENYFIDFIKTLKCPLGHYKRNASILRWLSTTTRDQAVNKIYRYISSEGRLQFADAENQMRNLIRRRDTPGLPTEYLDNGGKIEICENDPLWFEKGVACGHIAIPLVNVFRHQIILGNDAIADNNADDAILLSIEIIKYMYNLLTNFEKQEITLLTNIQEIPVNLMDSVAKPEYSAMSSPFENGWKQIKSGLFEHFLSESWQDFELARLDKLPEDLRLLMTALIYFSRKKPEDTKCEVYSTLLSYIALSIVFDGANEGDTNSDMKKNVLCSVKPSLDPITDKKEINEEDVLIAKTLLGEYFRNIRMAEAKDIFDPKMLHPLVEFQHCLLNLNYLNKLCGCSFNPTNYSRTYNGTFVYLMVHIMKTQFGGDGLMFLKQKLNPAPTVLALLLGFIETYDELMYT